MNFLYSSPISLPFGLLATFLPGLLKPHDSANVDIVL